MSIRAYRDVIDRLIEIEETISVVAAAAGLPYEETVQEVARRFEALSGGVNTRGLLEIAEALKGEAQAGTWP